MRPNVNLPASVEERLAGWARIQEGRRAAPTPVAPGPTITLSRQFGCEGFPLAQRLQERLSAATGAAWSIFDKALLEKVAQDEGIALRILDGLGDATRSLEAYGFLPRGAITHDAAFTKVAGTLVKVAQQGHAIIVGRGGAVLCQRLANAFHFRLEAPEAWRVASLERRLGVTREEAERRVRVEQKARDQFLTECLGADVSDRSYYDAIFNNDRHSVDQIAAAIQAYLKLP